MKQNQIVPGAKVETVAIGDMQVRVSGKGFPLILLHGFTTTSEFWREQVEEFSASYQVIRPNLPGHGISPAPKNRNYTIDAFVEDLERIFDHFSIRRAALVGLSMGGIIAQKFAFKNSHLLDALVLVDTKAQGVGEEVRAENVLAAIDDLGIAAASQHVAARSFSSAAPPELIEWAKREVIQTPDFVARAAIVSITTSDTRHLLSRITIPTLVIVGEKDIITPPSESQVLSQGIPNSKLVVIKNAGHFSMLEEPVEFNRTLRAFLKQHSGVPATMTHHTV
jgi:pimeloyl-ACP methyl ester carboxylesterase